MQQFRNFLFIQYEQLQNKNPQRPTQYTTNGSMTTMKRKLGRAKECT